MEREVSEIYESFDARRKTFEAGLADKQDIEEMEKKIKKRKLI